MKESLKNQKNKINLIYIGGCGHSGSTLLDLILGSHSKIMSAGELNGFNHFKLRENPCSCGKIIINCNFWDSALSSFLGKIKSKNYVSTNISYLSFRHLFKWSNVYYPHPKNKEKYLKYNKYLFQSILKASNKSIVVDSSKIPTRALYLYKSGLFNMKLIYLVRNGKAFIHSFHKKGEPNYKAATYWTLRNYRMRKIIKEKMNPKDVLQVHYEHLASNPEKEIRRITKFIGIDFEKEMLNFREREHHIIGGNPMKNREDPEIKLDEKWKEKLSLVDKLVFKLIGGRMNKKLGYK